MKLSCMIGPKRGLIVGYAQGKRNKVKAVVIMEGRLHAFGLKDITLLNIPEELGPSKVVKLSANRSSNSAS